MAALIKFDQAQFARLANELRLVKRLTAAEMLNYMAKILCRYLINVTPPFGHHPFSETPKSQQRIGIIAIIRDFRKQFIPLTDFHISRLTGHFLLRRAGVWIRKYAAAGNVRAINKMFRDLGIHAENIKVIRRVSAEFAKSNLLWHRRPHQVKTRYFVLDGPSIKRARTELIKHVGRAKAGWLEAYERLGIKEKPAAWIRAHRAVSSGKLIDQSHQNILPSMTLVNSTKGAATVDTDVVAVAMNELYRSGIQKQLENIGRKRINRFNAGQRQLS